MLAYWVAVSSTVCVGVTVAVCVTVTLDATVAVTLLVVSGVDCCNCKHMFKLGSSFRQLTVLMTVERLSMHVQIVPTTLLA
jgi:hypothetical protein